MCNVSVNNNWCAYSSLYILKKKTTTKLNVIISYLCMCMNLTKIYKNHFLEFFSLTNKLIFFLTNQLHECKLENRNLKIKKSQL